MSNYCSKGHWENGMQFPCKQCEIEHLSENRKDAERYRVLKSGDFSVEKFVSSSYGWKFVPMEELDAAIDAAMQKDKP